MCSKHGGGPRCTIPGCTNGALSRVALLCHQHGGRHNHRADICDATGAAAAFVDEVVSAAAERCVLQVGRRIDVCCRYELAEGGAELRWCAGEVVTISNGSNIRKPPPARSAYFGPGEAVMVRWDANAARDEEESESTAQLPPSMRWQKGAPLAEGVWRFQF